MVYLDFFFYFGMINFILVKTKNSFITSFHVFNVLLKKEKHLG